MVVLLLGADNQKTEDSKSMGILIGFINDELKLFVIICYAPGL